MDRRNGRERPRYVHASGSIELATPKEGRRACFALPQNSMHTEVPQNHKAQQIAAGLRSMEQGRSQLVLQTEEETAPHTLSAASWSCDPSFLSSLSRRIPVSLFSLRALTPRSRLSSSLPNLSAHLLLLLCGIRRLGNALFHPMSFLLEAIQGVFAPAPKPTWNPALWCVSPSSSQ